MLRIRIMFLLYVCALSWISKCMMVEYNPTRKSTLHAKLSRHHKQFHKRNAFDRVWLMIANYRLCHYCWCHCNRTRIAFFYTPNTNRDYFYRLNYCRVSWQIAMHNLWNQWIIINDKYPYVRLAAITIFTKRGRERMKKKSQQKKTLSYFHWS